MTNTDIIINAAAQALTGDLPPSFRSEDFAALVVAITQATAPNQQAQLVSQEVGKRFMLLLLCHLQASMHTERELCLLRTFQQ